MKNLISTIAVLLVGYLSCFGQNLHTPAEILEIMEKSKLTYEIGILEAEIQPPDRSNNLNFNQYYRVKDKDGLTTYQYQIDSLAQTHLAKAEEYFKGRKFSLARDMYLKALAVDPSYYPAMTYIGQTYGIEGDWDKAIEWYEKVIDSNYIDYMAHWFLADAYKEKGENKKAIDEITIARILNRNNPRIKISYDLIYNKNKLNTEDWSFNPQMIIDSVGPTKVKILSDMDWIGYAMVKAVWKYEPGHKESMGGGRGMISTTETRECLLGLSNSLEKKTLKKFPEFKAFKDAMDKDMVNEFIFYEIILPEYPFVAYQLPEEFLSTIVDYVKEIRGNQR